MSEAAAPLAAREAATAMTVGSLVKPFSAVIVRLNPKVIRPFAAGISPARFLLAIR